MRKQSSSKFFYILLVLYMIGIMFAGGCGKQEVDEYEEVYSAFFSDLQMPPNAYNFQKTGSVLYATTYDFEANERHYFTEAISGDVSYTELMTSSAAYQEIMKDSIDCFADDDVNLYIVLVKEEDPAAMYYLCKFTGDGQELFRENLPAFVNGETYLRTVVNDTGMICIAATDLYSSSHLYFYDRDGNYQGVLAVTEGFRAFGIGKNGDFYYVKNDMTSNSKGELVAVDCEKKEAVDTYLNFPDNNGFDTIYLMAGTQHDFLSIGEDYLYGYQLESQTCEPILEWAEYALTGEVIAYVCEEENGDILAVVNGTNGTPKQLVRFTTDKNKITNASGATDDTQENNNEGSGDGSVDGPEGESLTGGGSVNSTDGEGLIDNESADAPNGEGLTGSGSVDTPNGGLTGSGSVNAPSGDGLTGSGSVDAPDREIITLGITCNQVNTSYYEELRNYIAQFNRKQDQYWVELKLYGDEGSVSHSSPFSESRDGMNAINLEMAAGNGPDLIYWNSNFAIYARKGLLEDLSSYLETSEVLSKEDYLEPAVNLFTVDDKLLALPAYLAISTCYGYTDQIGENTELGFEEMLKLDRKYEDIPLFEIQQNPDNAVVFLADTVYSFIDWEKGTCAFDSKEFQLFLEYCNGVIDNEIDTWFSQLGEDYLIERTISFSAIPFIEARAKAQRDITFVGYPSWAGSRTHIDDMAAGYCIGISTKSKHKDGAWEFLEYLHGSVLAGDYNIHSGTKGFPAQKSYLEKYLFGLVGTKNTVKDIEYTITEEDTDFVMELLKNADASSIKMHSSIVLDIIREEAAAYFAGDKPVEDVTEIIQNRIQLYLDENY